ncbi:hypothetical protein [Streptomyces aidingensis]|uniref:Uncharacterized protein n=1 Tax=Streptomyces aidingensis TaxID=910347 RepID=A0A1I1ES22_9ACTN|nr:hypothetical protein [Streptomyces aidingensis]SFB87703.1 hypothetical protein SAMN05421773_101351 [Streptomyces aidingensis]
MSEEQSEYVRLRIDMVLEASDVLLLIEAARSRIAEDELMPDEERNLALEAVSQDAAEALAYLVDPIDLVSEVPGVELAHASWSSELAEYDPEEEWPWDEEEWDTEEGDGGAEELPEPDVR